MTGSHEVRGSIPLVSTKTALAKAKAVFLCPPDLPAAGKSLRRLTGEGEIGMIVDNLVSDN